MIELCEPQLLYTQPARRRSDTSAYRVRLSSEHHSWGATSGPVNWWRLHEPSELSLQPNIIPEFEPYDPDVNDYEHDGHPLAEQ